MISSKTWAILSKGLIKEWDVVLSKIDAEEIKQLTKGMTSEDYYQEQLMGVDAYTKRIEQIVADNKDIISTKSLDALKSALGLVDTELAKIGEVDFKAILNQDELLLRSESLTDLNDTMLKGLVKQSVNKHLKIVNSIGNSLPTQVIASGKVIRQERVKAIVDGISAQINKPTGALNSPPNVVYSNGRQVSFRTYMEMSSRTAIQSLATEKLEQSTDQLGIIFFLASEHSDCADDHRDYQGKIYVKRNWQTIIKQAELIPRIREFINSKQLMFFEDVIEKPIWFTKRPNCRHRLVPITIKQALGNITELKQTLKTKKPGDYSKKNVKENYEALKQQRKNERKIRHWKDVKDNNMVLYERTKDINVLKEIKRADYFIKQYQAKQRELLQSTPALVREYAREDNVRMAKDLGIKKG